MQNSLGPAGNLAKAFINSKLTLLLMVGIVIVGYFSAMLTPREEEPQISVPIANVFVQYPGASPLEVEQHVLGPLERTLLNIDGVEYVYSTATPGQAMFIVRYEVGLNVEESMVKLYEQILKHMDDMPTGVSMPLIKVRGIDDVPIMALTLFSETESDLVLRKIALELQSEIEAIPDVAETSILGGRREEVTIELIPEAMAQYHVDPLQLVQQLQAQQQQLQSGQLVSNNEAFSVVTGKFLEEGDQLKNLMIASSEGKPVFLHQVARINEGAGEPNQYVGFAYGTANREKLEKGKTGLYQAVTLAISKRPGKDAMRLAETINEKIALIEGNVIPSSVELEVTRNYGESASEKVSELLMHLFWAVVSVTILVTLSMGWRGGLVVFLSLPITFALTLFSYYMLDYTLNRITLFALVFVTGIIVDDSIIVAENMHRHFKMKKLPPMQAALAAIAEVGNPTILATFTVIVAVLPMVFVSGLMGPYMSPMPIGASLAMIFSLFAALMFTPWLAYRLMGKIKEHKKDKAFVLEETALYKVYAKLLGPMLDKPLYRWSFLLITTALLIGSMMLVVFRVVPLKMLPFDNKNEFQIVMDLPEGSTLEQTQALARELVAYLSDHPEVESLQSYVGTSAPITFNGLVRHYDLRRMPHQGDIQVVLTEKHKRDVQSHLIAKSLREELQHIGQRFDANIKVVEVPPGPPVMSTIVAEIYGPDPEERIRIAEEVANVFRNTEGVVDTDIQLEEDQTEYQLVVDQHRAAMAGLMPEQVVKAVSMSLYGHHVTDLSAETNREPVGIFLQLPQEKRSSLNDLGQLQLANQQGKMVPVADLITISKGVRSKSISHKNHQDVIYVLADVAGRLESPAYAMVDMGEALSQIKVPNGYSLREEWTSQPTNSEDYVLKWDGEWQITFEVFRDLGGAFAVALIGIYVLIVGWFQNFKTPIIMMIAIPLSLVGIFVGHWITGAFFSATSMIGMIALAGIMVRNSVLLIDFVNIRLEEGVPLRQALIESGAVRTMPIILTAGSVVVGAFVILFDPIFQGLAVSFLGGTIAATILTLVVVPVVFYMSERKKWEHQS